VLPHHPSLFRRYIAVSPAVVADPGFYDDGRRVTRRGSGNPARMTVARVSATAGSPTFVERLEAELGATRCVVSSDVVVC